jgi:hypothetical protein
MNLKKEKSRGGRMIVYAAAALAASSLAAKADTVSVTATFEGLASGGTESITSSNEDGNYVGGVYSGTYKFSNVNVTGTDPGAGDTPTLTAEDVYDDLTGLPPNTTEASHPSPPEYFTAVCIDFEHEINSGNSTTWTVEDLDDVTSSDNYVGITTDQAKAITALTQSYDSMVSPTSDQSDQYQLAVWDVIYNGTGSGNPFGSTASPSPYVNFATDTNVTTALASALAAYTYVTTTTLGEATPVGYALVDPDTGPGGLQDFTPAIVIVTPSFSPTSVPLPAAASVGFSMLGGIGVLAAIRRRSSRKSRIAE